jgi:hypothetical protein
MRTKRDLSCIEDEPTTVTLMHCSGTPSRSRPCDRQARSRFLLLRWVCVATLLNDLHEGFRAAIAVDVQVSEPGAIGVYTRTQGR